jgi:hypothetical protein
MGDNLTATSPYPGRGHDERGDQASSDAGEKARDVKSPENKTMMYLLRCPLGTDRYTLHLYALSTKFDATPSNPSRQPRSRSY